MGDHLSCPHFSPYFVSTILKNFPFSEKGEIGFFCFRGEGLGSSEIIENQVMMCDNGGGYYSSKKTDDICEDVCGQVLLFIL